MTTPTPDEITAALAVLRASGAVGNSTLDEIEAENNPTAPMVHTMRRELLSYFRSHGDVPDFGTLSDMLTHLAAESGLRITTDPAPRPDADTAQLDALPDGSTVLDRQGVMWQRWTTAGLSVRWWAHAPRLMPASGTWSEGSGKWTSAALIAQRGPVLVIHTAEDGQQ